MSTKGGPVLILSLTGGAARPPISYATALELTENHDKHVLHLRLAVTNCISHLLLRKSSRKSHISSILQQNALQ